MAKGLCSGCRDALTIQNSSSWAIRRGSGYCRSCKKNENERNKKIPQRPKEKWQVYRQTLSGRHQFLRLKMRAEGVLQEDALWNLRFYSALVVDNECHYCGGSLSPSSHGLDRVNNNEGHTAANVVPCCKRCNSVKSDYFTYSEMMLLSPTLRMIREARG